MGCYDPCWSALNVKLHDLQVFFMDEKLWAVKNLNVEFWKMPTLHFWNSTFKKPSVQHQDQGQSRSRRSCTFPLCFSLIHLGRLACWWTMHVQALVTAVPQGSLVLLDLYAEVFPLWKRTEHFYGASFIYCMLHNFGGNTEMYGALQEVRLSCHTLSHS